MARSLAKARLLLQSKRLFGRRASACSLSQGCPSPPVSTTRGRLWAKDAGAAPCCGSLAGGNSFAWGINNVGQVVGESESSVAGGRTHAFIWQSATGMQDLGTLPGGLSAIAYGINNRGQIVGLGYEPINGITLVRAV